MTSTSSGGAVPAVGGRARRSTTQAWLLLAAAGLLLTFSFPGWGEVFYRNVTFYFSALYNLVGTLLAWATFKGVVLKPMDWPGGVPGGGGGTPGLWFLVPLALVPLGIAAVRRPMTWAWFFTCYAFAFLWFLSNLHWLYPVTYWGVFALCWLLALYWALFMWGLQRVVVQLRWPAMIALPVVWVAVEYLRSTLFSGFPWFILGNALAGNVVLIQIADLLGVWGVSFFAAMTAGWIVDLLRLPLVRQGRFNPTLLALTGVWLATAIFVLSYGLFRMHQGGQTPGPTVAVVQENIPQDQKDNPSLTEKAAVFGRHVALSRAAVGGAGEARPELIVWPETSVPQPVNPEFRSLVPRNEDGRDMLALSGWLDGELRKLATGANAYLVAGSPYAAREEGPWIHKNTALMYEPGRGQSPTHYAKRHLVPFGETVPFGESAPWLHRMLLSLTPYGPDGDYSLAAGTEWTRFTIPATAGPSVTADASAYSFGVPICYEDVMPYPGREFSRPRGGHKGVDFLVSISNDGWYRSAGELDQHLQMDQLRAVENRVPVARAVNTGNSGFVDSNGQIAELVDVHGRSRFVAGFAKRTLALDARVTVYSRLGDLFPMLCGIVAVLAVGWTIVRPRRGSAG